MSNISKQKSSPSPFTKSRVGLHIRDRSARFVELLGRKNPRLGRFGEINIPAGVIVSGEIEAPGSLAKILSILRQDVGIKSVRVSIPTEQTRFLRLSVPSLKKHTVNAAIAAQMEKSNAPELLFDYRVLGKTKEGYEIQVYFVRKDIIAGYLEVLKKAGIKLRGFEPEAYALTRALALDETTLLADIGEERMCISIASGGVPFLASTSQTGQALLLDTLKNYFKVDEKEARKLLKRRAPEEVEHDRKARLAEPLRTQAIFDYYAQVGGQIKSQYVDWRSKPSAASAGRIEKIVVCGCGAEVEGCVDYLSRYLRDRVELANPWRTIASFDRYIPEMGFKESLRYTTALGLALSDKK